MALTRVTKHIIHGSLLVQFKYVENTGDFDLNSSQTTYTEVNSKNIVMTPQYADSILEDSTSMSVKLNNATDNVHDEISVALFVNGTNEYEKTSILGARPYGDAHSHTGGRNDRTAPTRRHSHIRNTAAAAGFTHAFTPASTNAQDQDIRVKNNATRNIRVRDFFFISKEISIGLATSGSLN